MKKNAGFIFLATVFFFSFFSSAQRVSFRKKTDLMKDGNLILAMRQILRKILIMVSQLYFLRRAMHPALPSIQSLRIQVGETWTFRMIGQ
jgi:hypothetical protein